MIPLFAVHRMNGRRRIQLILPLLILAFPFLTLWKSLVPGTVWRGSRTVWSLLSVVRGTGAELSAPDRSLLVHVW